MQLRMSVKEKAELQAALQSEQSAKSEADKKLQDAVNTIALLLKDMSLMKDDIAVLKVHQCSMWVAEVVAA